MEINFEKLSNNRLIVKPVGKINIENGDEFGNAVKSNLENIKELVFDFAEITYISSYGLRKILEFHKLMQEQKGALYIKNLNNDVKNVFEISGFNGFLNII